MTYKHKLQFSSNKLYMSIDIYELNFQTQPPLLQNLLHCKMLFPQSSIYYLDILLRYVVLKEEMFCKSCQSDFKMATQEQQHLLQSYGDETEVIRASAIMNHNTIELARITMTS